MATDGAASTTRWAERRRMRREASTRYLSRDAMRPVLAGLAVGLVVGIVLHVVDSAPHAVEFAGVAIRFIAGFGIFAGAIVGLARAVMLGRPGILLATAAFGVGGVAGYPIGPTWIPAATVGGTYSLTFQGTTVPAVSGTLTCTWLPGRWQVGSFDATARMGGPGGEKILLHASFTGRQVWIERTGMDGRPRAPYVDASAAVLEPPMLELGAPQRTEDGRSGTTVAILHIDATSPPAGAPARWSAPLAIDGVAGVSMEVTWDCATP